MGPSVCSFLFAAISCLLMGVEVRCNCTSNGLDIQGGQYKLTKQFAIHSMLIYQCPEGYYPYPVMTRMCQLNNKWNPPPRKYPLLRCRLVECPDPTVMEFGQVNPPQETYFVNNETTYECYTGYKLRGSKRRVCLPNGKWSGSTPICSRDTNGNGCADPGIPAGSWRTGNGFGIDDRVTYGCIANQFLVGSQERVCREDGEWTGNEPACYYRHTYDTSLEVSQAFGSAIKNSLTTLESLDDTQEGRKIRISKNGTLNIYIAMDISESIEEEHFEHARSAVLKLISKIASFSVSPNYHVLFFSSEIYQAVDILNFFDGKVKLSQVKSDVERFKINDRNTGTDLNRVFENFSERMSLLKRQVGDEAFKEQRQVIIVFTDGAYNMGGSPLPTVQGIKNMVYMNQINDNGSPTREDYLDIYIFAIGAEIFQTDLEPLVAGTGGQHFFRLMTLENLEQTFDDIIDEEEVQGLCGLHKNYETSDKNSKRKMFPWFAFIVIQNGNPRKCMGSLVTSKFVLTAAHCFEFGDLAEHVTVTIDDGHGMFKKVKRFTLHPNYNVKAKTDQGVKEFYDYDVALIQLEEDVKISPVARPICIPCTQETSNALQLTGPTTCKQHEEVLLKSHLERLSFLTKSDQIVSEKDVHAKLGDNRDECISHALEAPGITTKDPKVAVTDNFMCTGGLSPYRDHIACTGDSGGAVFKTAERRTVQVGVVSWGTKTLCSGSGLYYSDLKSRDFHINIFSVIPFLKAILGNNEQDEYAPLQFLEN